MFGQLRLMKEEKLFNPKPAGTESDWLFAARIEQGQLTV